MNPALSAARRVFSLYKQSKLRRLGEAPSWQRVPAGFEMWIDPAQWLDQRMLFGVYEPWVGALIGRAIRYGDICLDIGAHKGFFTMQMARKAGPEGRVLSFDPDPRAYECLDRNCIQNGLDQVTRLNLALGESDGEIEIQLAEKLGDSSRFRRNAQLDRKTPIAKTRMKTLDDVLDEYNLFDPHNQLAFVKIDAEGSEPLILDGMKRTLEIFSPILFLEFNFECLQAAGSSAQAFQQRLESDGFSLYRVMWDRDWLLRGRLRLLPLRFGDEQNDTVDTVAVRPDSPLRGRIESWIHE